MRAVSENHENVRPLLEKEQSDLLARIDELTVGGEIDLEFDDDFSDRGLVASEQTENRTLANVLHSQLSVVERALTRLDEGTYGTCETCGGSISVERLDAIPATSRCIEHAGAAPPKPAGK